MHKLIAGAVAALALAVLPGLALADAAGTAKGVDPAAEAGRNGTVQTLVVGADIFLGDVLTTGNAGQVQIQFADATKLVVGPNSKLTIEDYLLRNDGSAGKFVVDMLSGSFRFATGTAPKSRYQLKTPTGVIGIRGTGFDVFVAPNGETWIMLYHGAVRFCAISGQCQDITDLCEVGVYNADEAQIVGDARTTTGDTREQLKQYFLYAMNQNPLLKEFWMRNSFDCLHKRPDAPSGDDTPKPPSQDDGSSSSSSEEPPPPPPPSSSSEPPKCTERCPENG